jgi:hypothetical protein
MSDFTTVISKAEAKKAKAAAKKTQEFDISSKELFDCIVPGLHSGTVDITSLSLAQRLALLEGPTISLFVGNVLIRKNVPKRALMAVSAKVNDFIRKDPSRGIFHFPDSTVDISAVREVLDALTTFHGIGGYEVSGVQLAGRPFIEGVYIYQAGRFLGAGEHVKHIAKRLCVSISEKIIAYCELDTILKCVPASDGLFKHVANDLAHRRYKKTIPEIKEFETFLETRQALKKAMEKIDAEHQVRREALIEKKKKTGEKKRKAAMAEQQSKIQALKEKMGQGSGSVIILTAEQIDLLRKNLI